MQKRALITGITGQDGSYLAELLLSKDYDVYGLLRSTANVSYDNLTSIKDRISFVTGDVLDRHSLESVLKDIKPSEIYNLTGQSSVGESWKNPKYTMSVNANTPLNLLNAVRGVDDSIKFFQASSAEMFGKVDEGPQNERTPFQPQNPYGVSKLCAHLTCLNYRDSYGLFICCGILYNHESERRKPEFVTRKVSDAFARIKLGKIEKFSLGNLDAKRDWGYAPEYVEAMWRTLQHDSPDDYVIASGETHTIREFVEAAAKVIGMDIKWQGKGVDEVGIDSVSGKTLVTIDPQFYRPTEAGPQWGDPTKAKTVLGWSPKINFEKLVDIMVTADVERLSAE